MKPADSKKLLADRSPGWAEPVDPGAALGPEPGQRVLDQKVAEAHLAGAGLDEAEVEHPAGHAVAPGTRQRAAPATQSSRVPTRAVRAGSAR